MNDQPPGWITASLGSIVDILDAQRVPVNKAERAKRSGSVPYYGATGQVGWINEPIFDEELLLVGEDGVPFLDPAKLKSYIIRGPSWVNNHAHVLRSLSGITSNRYLMHFLNWFDYRSYVNGTTRLKLTQGSLRVIPVRLPPQAEQERIVERIERIFAYLDAAKTTLEVLHDKLKHLRSAILTDAFYTNRNLPPRWTKRAAGELCDINPRFSKKSFSDEQLLTFIPMSAVETETCRADVSKVRTMGELRSRSYRGFREGDILVAKITPSMENGKVAVAQGLVDGWGMGSTEFHILRPKTGVEPRYIAWFTLQKKFRARARMSMTGTAGQLRVPAAYLKEVLISLPPAHEQQRIVERIDRDFHKVNMIEKSIKSLIDQTNKLRRSVLTEAFTGRLVSQDADDEPASVLLERIAISLPDKARRRRRPRA